jgi:hypothetical protein
VGALHLAEQFPPTIDLDDITAMNMRFRKSQIDWLEAAEALEGRDEPLREAILRTLERSRAELGASLRGGLVTPARNLRAHHANSVFGTGGPVRGRELPDEPPPARPALVGLIRKLDRDRNVYSLGERGPGELVGELGSLLVHRQDGAVPVWITPEGRLATRRSPLPGKPRPPARAAVRWLMAPLVWRGEPRRARRLAAVLRRAALYTRRAAAAAQADGAPDAYLHASGGEGRLPLWSAVHPITGDQLLTTWRFDAIDMGYDEPALLGHLEARAPVTGRLSNSQPELLWASRFGRRVRVA